MSDGPATMDGYVRVSRVAGRAGDSFISPTVQREQIEGWAKMRGVHVAAWHEDLDQSGGKIDRPGLTAMLARIESGDTGGVIVAKLDRLSRLGVGDALKLVERITEAGGTIAALDLGIDPTTPFGEFGMTLMLAMARMERRRIADSWDQAKVRAMDRGARVGPTPIGFERRPDGTLDAHPDHAACITEAYRRAARDGVRAAMTYLQGAIPNHSWTMSTTRRMLASRAYLGDSHYGGIVKRDAHPALTDRATWEAAQGEPCERRRAKTTYPLSGIASCGTCGGPMVGTASAGKRGYRCAATVALVGTPACPAPANTLAAGLEGYVVEALREAWGSREFTVGEGDTDIAAIEQALIDAEAELDAFASDLTARRALGARYHEHLESRATAVDAAQAAYRECASRQARQTHIRVAELLDTDDPAELRDLFAATLGEVVVARGRGALADRVRLVSYGDDNSAGIPALEDSAHSAV